MNTASAASRMKYWASILGTHSHDAHPAIILHFDSKRYMFNCGEGTQRICVETGTRLLRLKNIFLTRTSWDCVGGLPGLLLTLGDLNQDAVSLHGPPKLKHFIKAIHPFANRPEMQIHVHQQTGSETPYMDENLTIIPICLRASNAQQGVSEDEADKDDAQEVDDPKWQESHASVPSTCYVCTGPVKPGRFDPVAAKKLGVKPGPDFGRLTKGDSVEAQDGTLVHPNQCIGPATPGAVFFIVDCPHESYIQSLTMAPHLQQFKNTKENPVTCIFHILGRGVLQNTDYVEWIRSFGSTTYHIIMSEAHSPQTLTLRSAGLIQQQLNYIDAEIFPLPFTKQPDEQVDLQKDLQLSKNAVYARPLLNFQFTPTVKLDESACYGKLPVEPPKKELVPYLGQVHRERKQLMSAARAKRMDCDDDVRIIPLGTGSALPSKYRNVSSTLITLPTGSVFLDAGEGTYGQLFRSCGLQTSEILKNLKLIFVSHMHADHHLGVFMLISRWNEAVGNDKSKVLYIVAPTQFSRWMNAYSKCEDVGWDMIRFINNRDFLWNSNTSHQDGPRIQELRESLNLTSFQTIRVDHCSDSFAVVFTYNGRTKIAFSGDCRPSEDLIKVGQGATFLIHEATLENDMRQDAIDKKHCTTGEALDVARRMMAERVLLTHFSQRYPKVPVMNPMRPSYSHPSPPPSASPPKRSSSKSPSRGNSPNRKRQKSNTENDTSSNVVLPIVGIAFDMMQVNRTSFDRLPSFISALHALVAEGEGESVNEEKTSGTSSGNKRTL
ncbi:hypothetical protein SeMB42_g00246 [Synchytrium endobioticum]|uniref:ribonuclease Z n=1 Tax=Synchytrium endobioticum TaxID=286115 RepID=A0A507CVI3_9FUNG|nr:hypothetical protein SeLEV6574_g05198 [Synchytrium endobioticum]TPX54532.1 hypothetical protein SeMB42_g00246 [Synchytrium endobioticum]